MKSVTHLLDEYTFLTSNETYVTLILHELIARSLYISMVKREVYLCSCKSTEYSSKFTKQFSTALSRS